ncbi:oligosaccharide flippase family protein [Prolixibacteraceae bacterium Z1-6]|uniref:Oligosaccharide flippase family protein n=1 Tax=Draconibacterium aestuarii TaxID=2998507 RepID=A0A9X3F4X2_9BACT|nr:oligosaccharide flippase family protein [Prolixibacteraceae bacterium Z1-6]
MSEINNPIGNLFKSEFYRSILSLFSGMCVARIVPALFAVVIARIYNPDDFGLFILYLTIASVLSIITTGKYENAIILVESSHEKRQIFSVAQKINTVINGSLLMVLFLGSLLIGDYERKDILLLVLIPLYAFFFSSIQLIRNVFISKKQFNQISILETSRAVLTGGLQCLLFVWPDFGLFLGAVLAQGIIYGFYSWRVAEALYFRLTRLNADELDLAKRYIDFPKFSVLSEVFNFISSQLPVFLIKPFFGSTMLGLYSFSHRYISIPVQLLSKSISSVYLQKCQDLKDNHGELGELTLSLFKKQFLLGILPFTILGLWGKVLFVFVFGAEWEFSGYLAQIISPWLFAVMLGSPLSAIFIVREKQRLSMVFNITLLAVRAASLIVGGWVYNDITMAVGFYSLTGFVFFVALTAYSLWLAGANLKRATFYVVKTVLIIVPFILLKLWL